MKVEFCQDENSNEIQIIIKARELDTQVLEIMSKLKVKEKKIIGIIEKENFLLDPKNILYFESVDKKSYAYTLKDVYTVDKRLYELENELSFMFFQRCSKSMIVNLKQIKSIKAMFNSTLSILMENDERIIVSRQYTNLIKERLV